MTTKRPAGLEQEHLSWSDIESCFLRTEQPEERRPLYHLLCRCDACREAAHPLLELYREGQVDDLSSWVEIELAVSEWEAADLWARIEEDFPETMSPGEQTAVLRGDDRWPTWGLAVHLARQSLQEDDLERASRWANVARLGALEMPPDQPAPDSWVEELKAFTQAAVGDALRRQGDFEGAAKAFRQARQHLEAFRDNGDFLPFRPKIFDREAALFRDLGRFEDAVASLDQALEAWEVVYRHREAERAQLLRHKARVLRRMHQLEDALDLQEEAAALLQAEVA